MATLSVIDATCDGVRIRVSARSDWRSSTDYRTFIDDGRAPHEPDGGDLRRRLNARRGERAVGGAT